MFSDPIALILILLPIALLALLVLRLAQRVDYFIGKIPTQEPPSRNTLDSFLLTQRHWSAKTFGIGAGRWKGIVAHVEKELREIERDPLDLEEWIDVIILGFDGAWRTGASNHAIIAALFAKQAKNRRRQWIVSEDESVPSEHYKPTPRLSEVLWPTPPSPSRPLIEEVAGDFDQWKDEVYMPAMAPVAPVAPTSIDISVYPHKVTGKWVVQVGDDTSRLSQFESEAAARQYARQTGEMLKMQMKHLEETLNPLFIVEAAENPASTTSTFPSVDFAAPVEPPVYAVDTPGGQPKKTNLRRLSSEDQQRILSDPEAYAEWRGPCGLEATPPKEGG